MEKQPTRIGEIDILRGMGIIFMIMGHIGFGGKFDRYIHSFHMPLFFMVSGYLYNPKRCDSIYMLILKKIRKVLFPYCFFACVNYFFWLILVSNGQDIVTPLIKLVTYNMSGLPIGGALWFLTALFWVEVMYILIDRLIKNICVKHGMIFLLSMGASLFQTNCTVRFPLMMDIAVVCLGFYHLGRLFREKETSIKASRFVQCVQENKRREWIIICFLFIANLVLTFINPYVNMKMGWYGYVPIFWINSVLGVSVYYLVAIKMRYSRMSSHFLFILQEIGKDSIVYLGFNQLAILIVNFFWGSYIENIHLSILKNILYLFIVIAFLYNVSKVLSREKFKTLIGR